MKITLVTYQDQGKYPGEGSWEDARLIAYLAAQGLDISFAIWTDATINWSQFEAVLLKSPWDYFDKIDLFRNWLDELDRLQVRVLNPTNIIRWNINKQYLLEVEQAGYAIVPTLVAPASTSLSFHTIYDRLKTHTVIVKPAVSGGAKNTFSIPRSRIAEYQEKVNSLLKEEAYLVQPFMPEIQTHGEWSLLFFNGRFSHSVLKVPQTGDFRVQHYFGGAIIPTTPPPAILDYAQRLVHQFAPGCLYARVDGVESGGEFKLMELELIEPMLYLMEQEELYTSYFQAICQLVPQLALHSKY